MVNTNIWDLKVLYLYFSGGLFEVLLSIRRYLGGFKYISSSTLLSGARARTGRFVSVSLIIMSLSSNWLSG